MFYIYAVKHIKPRKLFYNIFRFQYTIIPSEFILH